MLWTFGWMGRLCQRLMDRAASALPRPSGRATDGQGQCCLSCRKDYLIQLRQTLQRRGGVSPESLWKKNKRLNRQLVETLQARQGPAHKDRLMISTWRSANIDADRRTTTEMVKPGPENAASDQPDAPKGA